MTTKKTQPKTATAPKADDSAKAPEAGVVAATQEPVKDPAAKDGAPNDQGSAKAPDAKAKRKVLKVTAHGESFRRANLQFSRQARTLYLDDLSEAQVKALKAEPRLSVVEDEVEE